MKRTISKFTAAFMLAAAIIPANVYAAESKELVIAVDADVDTLHPSDNSTIIEYNILNQIYDSLIYMNKDGAHDPEPRIADSWEISEDGTEYTFHLRDDVTFHDGSALTSADVKYSIEMYQASEYQGSLTEMLDSVETPDDYTVVCKLQSPYSPFLLNIASMHIASEAYAEQCGDDFSQNPMGCGPYKFVSRTNGSNIVLEANDSYYRGEPNIKEVTFEVVPDSSTTAIALQTGEIGFAEIDSSCLAQLEANPDINIEKVATSTFSYICMNTEKEPFDNVLVRQAVNYAIDRENIINVCYDGNADVNSNICAKSRFGYSDDQFQYTYDPDKAKELLAEAGIETPYDLGEMLVAEKYANLATVIQNDLKAVGLEFTINQKEFNSYIGELVTGNYMITALNMTLDGDTQMLEMAYTTDFINMANNARYSNEEMDELFAQSMVETDQNKRAELFDQILIKAQDEAIYAVIGNPMTLFAYSNELICPEFDFEGAYYIYDFAWQD